MKQLTSVLLVPSAGPQMIFETSDPVTYAKVHAANRRTSGTALFVNGQCLHPGVFGQDQIGMMEAQLQRAA